MNNEAIDLFFPVRHVVLNALFLRGYRFAMTGLTHEQIGALFAPSMIDEAYRFCGMDCPEIVQQDTFIQREARFWIRLGANRYCHDKRRAMNN